MVTIDRAVPLDALMAPVAYPTVREIRFGETVKRGVEFHVVFANDATAMTASVRADVSAAPFGVFARWRPMTTIHVPALAPDDQWTADLVLPRPMARTLGPPDRITSGDLLTALAQDDSDRRPEARAARRIAARLATVTASGAGGLIFGAPLPADPFDVLGRPGRYYAGNINVFVGGKAVERHLAQALRIYPGRRNVAFFIVGDGLKDRYRFAVDVPDGWDARLTACARSRRLFSFPLPGRLAQLHAGEVLEAAVALVQLEIDVPATAEAGTVVVHARRESRCQDAKVEFDLDASALGAGCYAV